MLIMHAASQTIEDIFSPHFSTPPPPAASFLAHCKSPRLSGGHLNSAMVSHLAMSAFQVGSLPLSRVLENWNNFWFGLRMTSAVGAIFRKTCRKNKSLKKRFGLCVGESYSLFSCLRICCLYFELWGNVASFTDSFPDASNERASNARKLEVRGSTCWLYSLKNSHISNDDISWGNFVNCVRSRQSASWNLWTINPSSSFALMTNV